jgi:hypothetical protein
MEIYINEETVFHAISVNNCFKIFKLVSCLSAYAKINSMLIGMFNVKSILKILKNISNNYLILRLCRSC